MNKWIAEFDLEDGDTMPEHMELNFKGAKIDFYCRPQEPKSEWEHDHEILKAYSNGANEVLDKIRAEIIELRSRQNVGVLECLDILDKYKAESEDKE